MESDQNEKKANKDDWEEVVMMLELPNGSNLNASKKDLYLQVAGMWSDRPVVKLDNMIYEGNISETIGSNLFIEGKERDGTQQTHRKKDNERLVLTSRTNVMLNPVYLENKTDPPSSQGDTAAKHNKDLEKT